MFWQFAKAYSHLYFFKDQVTALTYKKLTADYNFRQHSTRAMCETYTFCHWETHKKHKYIDINIFQLKNETYLIWRRQQASYSLKIPLSQPKLQHTWKVCALKIMVCLVSSDKGCVYKSECGYFNVWVTVNFHKLTCSPSSGGEGAYTTRLVGRVEGHTSSKNGWTNYRLR